MWCHFLSAYLSTTVSTVSAMIASFFASQQTFCFLQLQAEKEAAAALKNRFRSLDPTDAIITKVRLQRWPKKFLLGCVNSPPRPEAGSRNLGQNELEVGFTQPIGEPFALLSRQLAKGNTKKTCKN